MGRRIVVLGPGGPPTPPPIPGVPGALTSTYTFELASAATGEPLGELRQATGRNVRFIHNRMPSFTAQVPADHPHRDLIQRRSRTLIKGYETWQGAKVLRFLGPIVQAEKVRASGQGSISFTAFGQAWRLGKFLVGRSATGFSYGTPISLQPADLIAKAVLADANLQGNTGIREGGILTCPPTAVGPWRFMPADEALAALSSPADGFDWKVTPLEPYTDATGLVVGRLDIEPFMGTTRLDAAFEFGTGRHNVAEFRDVGDDSFKVNRAHNLPPNFPDNANQAPIKDDNVAAIAEDGLFEAVVPADLVVDDLRSKIVQEHVRVRANGRRVITFTPVPDFATDPAERRVPRFGADFETGDIVPFRAREAQLVRDLDGAVIGLERETTVDALFRVWAASLAIGDEGVVTPTLGLLEEDAG